MALRQNPTSVTNIFKLRNPILFLFILFFLPNCLFSQSFDFISYGVEDGLSQSEARCVFQDSRGYLWVGTAGGGVCRFDGLKFKEFGKRDGLAGEIISCIAEDSTGNMLFGTIDGGVAVFDGKTFSKINQGSGLGGNEVRCIIAKKNVIWIGLPTGVFEFNPQTNLIRQIASVNNLNSMCTDQEGNLWIGSSDGFSRVSRGLKIGIDLKLPVGADQNVLSIYNDKKGAIYVALTEGLKIFNISSGTFYENKLCEKLTGKSVRNFFTDSNGALWVCTFNNLLIKYTSDGGIISYDASNGLTAETIYCVSEDDTKHIWIGTREQSLVKLRSESFSYFGNLPGLGSPSVFKILQDNAGRIWVGSNLDGLHIYNPELESGKNLVEVLNGGKMFKQPVAIAEDLKKQIWVGHYDGATCLVNDHPVKTILNGIRVRSLLADSKGNLWIGTWGKGLFRYDGVNFENFTMENKKLPNDYVHSLYEDKKGVIWIGTGNGLVKCEFEKTGGNKITFFGAKDGLCNAYVGCIVEDPFGNIWFHTDVCIMRFDGKKIREYTDENGLASNTYYLLSFDSFGQLWVGTNKGIDRVRINEAGDFLSIKNYSRDEGFRGIECNSRAVCVAKDASIWFGTVKGVIRYNPSKDIEDIIEPSTHITGVRLFLEQTDWMWSGTKEVGWFHLPEKLILESDQNHLTFLYEAIHLQSPQSTKYKFMLAGFDSIWQPVTEETQFTYTNLPPGDYEFRVIASNSEGKWNAKPVTSCPIKILPPPPPYWKTWWFILISIIVVGGILYYAIVGRNKRIIRQKQILEAEVRERTIEISRQNEEKTVMLKEIHHRVKNNLQVISSLLNLQADGITDKKVLSLFEDCRHRVNSMALIHEKMYQSNNLVNIDIRNYIDELSRSLIDAYDTNKTIHLRTDIEDHPFRIDTIVPLGLILNEIISNSLKYAFEGKSDGELFVSLHQTSPLHFILEVADNGIGIPEPINFENAESLGMQLIMMLSGQISGKVSVKVDNGTKYRIEFVEEVKDRF